MNELIINFDDNGYLHSIYNEDINLIELGKLNISRASYVEPDKNGQWFADMSPLQKGVKLGPFELRSLALQAERNWINNYLSIN